jgi:hypothetical protein
MSALTRQKSTLFQWLAVPHWFPTGKDSVPAEHSIDPALLHRIAVMSAGTLDSLPQNGAVVTLLAVCGSTHRESYFDIVMAAIVGAASDFAQAPLDGAAMKIR